MKVIKGTHNEAVIYATTIEASCEQQVLDLCNESWAADCKIRIMPDCHSGKGRLMSRTEAKRTLSLDAFQSTMQGIYSSTVNQSTIDEAPMAYKPIEEILENIKDTVTVEKRIKPVYNIKSEGD